MAKKTNTATSSTSPPSDVLAAYQQLISRASGVSQGSTTTGSSPLQQQAFGSFGAIPGTYLPQAEGYAAEGAAPISEGDMARYSNPFQQNVIDATLANINEEDAQQQNQVTGNAIAQGALGGNRVGVTRAELARKQNLAKGQTIAGLNAANYGQALTAAQADREAKSRAAGQFAGLSDAALRGAGAQLEAGNSERGIATDFAKQPYDQASWLAKILGGIGPLQGQTTTNETPGPDPLSQMLGAGISLAGLFLKNGGKIPTFAGGGGIAVPSSRVHEMLSTALDLARKMKGGGVGDARGGAVRPGIAGYDLGGFVPDVGTTVPRNQSPFAFDDLSEETGGIWTLPAMASAPTIAPPELPVAQPLAPPMNLVPAGVGVPAANAAPNPTMVGSAETGERERLVPNDWRVPLISAGLGMMASQSPFLGTAIGEGGLAGLGSYQKAKAQQATQAQADKEFGLKERGVELDAKRLDQQAKDSAARLALETKRVALAENSPDSPLGKLEHDRKLGLVSEEDYRAAKATLGSAAMTDMPGVPLTAKGVPDPASQEQFLSGLDPSMAALIKGIANYQLDIPKVTSLRGGERARIAQIVSQYDPTFDMSQYGARAAMRKSITSGNYSNAINSANLVIQHLDTLKKSIAGLDNSNFTPYNTVANWMKSAGGDPAINKFNTARDAAASELAKVFKGTGSTSEEEIKAWKGNLDLNGSPAQVKAAIDQSIDLLASRLDTIRTQYQSAMGKPTDFNFLTPHSREVLKDLGVDASVLDTDGAIEGSGGEPPAPGAKQAPDGNWYVPDPARPGKYLQVQ